jgi:hypothetical protein
MSNCWKSTDTAYPPVALNFPVVKAADPIAPPKIALGGQTGVDRAILYWALRLYLAGLLP